MSSLYESAMNALKNGEPEQAIREIQRVMEMRAANVAQLELAMAVKEEIVSTTDFLEQKGWIA